MLSRIISLSHYEFWKPGVDANFSTANFLKSKDKI